jgi:hypothetical protein
VGSVFLSPLAIAGETLSAEEIKKLIVGNTVYAERLNDGLKFAICFGANGECVRHLGDRLVGCNYQITDDNQHCLILEGGAKLCTRIQSNGDGTYSRIKYDGTPYIKWYKVTTGCAF